MTKDPIQAPGGQRPSLVTAKDLLILEIRTTLGQPGKLTEEQVHSLTEEQARFLLGLLPRDRAIDELQPLRKKREQNNKQDDRDLLSSVLFLLLMVGGFVIWFVVWNANDGVTTGVPLGNPFVCWSEYDAGGRFVERRCGPPTIENLRKARGAPLD